MPRPSSILHPLLETPGSSQHKRVDDAYALMPDAADIDDRTLADMLIYIHQYARQVLFQEYKTDAESQNPYTELSNWLTFFENSLPFQMALFSRSDFGQLERNFSRALASYQSGYNTEDLKLLLDYCYFELMVPMDRLQKTVLSHDFELRDQLERQLRSNLVPLWSRFIQMSNLSAKYLCIGGRNFTGFLTAPWNIPVNTLFYTQEIEQETAALNEYQLKQWIGTEMDRLFSQMIVNMQQIAAQMPPFIIASLDALKGKNEPHLGLLFAFLRLFEYFKGMLNELTKDHLDFFYQNVLRLNAKPMKPDQVHLVFEVAKHLEKYPLPSGTRFKDGKDNNKADILFRLDNEIVLDKAKIADLKTLFLNQDNRCGMLEGAYIAPVANSADGKGEKFKENQPANWATLGAKPSKFIAPGQADPEDHPFARLGLVLSSSVLWLNEGNRKVNIMLTCSDGGNREIFESCFENLDTALQKTTYEITDETITKLEALFSEKAKAFLQEKLDEQQPFPIAQADKQGFLDTIDNDGAPLFTNDEKAILEVVLEEIPTGGYLLNEMPFAFIIRYFNQLLSIQEPYFIGSDLDGFWQTKDLVSCKPLLSLNSALRDWVTETLKENTLTQQVFSLQVSGPEGWYTPKNVPSIKITPVGPPTVTLEFEFILEPDEPAVVFYDEKTIGEFFKLECPYPMVKLEVNPEVRLQCEPCKASSDCCDPATDACCLQNKTRDEENVAALYHFFRHLMIKDASINVYVCGIKNLVVQNEESLQDVNSPILPWGARPQVGNEFYVGSKEIFCKNWQKVHINTVWKDIPSDFATHYSDYYTNVPFEDNSTSIVDSSFKLDVAVLENGMWNNSFHTNGDNLFFPNEKNKICGSGNTPCPLYTGQIPLAPDYHELTRPSVTQTKKLTNSALGALTVNTRDAFMRMTLRGVSFQHDRYAYVLARNLIKLSGLIDPADIPKLVTLANNIKAYLDGSGSVTGLTQLLLDIETHINNIEDNPGSNKDIRGLVTLLSNNTFFLDIYNILGDIYNLSNSGGAASPALDTLLTNFNALCQSFCNIVGVPFTTFPLPPNPIPTIPDVISLLATIPDPDTIRDNVAKIKAAVMLAKAQAVNIDTDITEICALLPSQAEIDNLGIPQEPYTPTLKCISLDYSATAEKSDITLVHLYPFANSSKTEVMELEPSLLPAFTDQGTLYIGLEDVRPGAVLHLLFQLAEASADSESDPAGISWQYLTNNRWHLLRKGFEVLSDKTERLSRSGIVQLILPSDISNLGNTIMPPNAEGRHLYWIKVSAPKSVAAVAEVVGIHTQSVLAVYDPVIAVPENPNLVANDPLRVGKPVLAGKISKPVQPDFSIKKTMQPYDSFGGQLSEKQGHFNIRISEHLRHKGRSVDAFDLERLVLEAFPILFKCKCISHTFGLSANTYVRDLEVAPGFLVVAVIPNLYELKAGNSPEPKVPSSVLADIKSFIQQRISSFAHIKVMNPRYEKVNIKITAGLKPGYDEPFYSQQLKTDIGQFMAPWHLGDSDKISFGQPLRYSDLLNFVEKLDYINVVTHLELVPTATLSGSLVINPNLQTVMPLTARSILSAGEICIEIYRPDCTSGTKPANMELPCYLKPHPFLTVAPGFSNVPPENQ